MTVDLMVWRKIRVGLKPSYKFMVEMSIQSLFDQRNFYQKLNMIFNGTGENQREDPKACLSVPALLFSSQVNYMLKEFHL